MKIPRTSNNPIVQTSKKQERSKANIQLHVHPMLLIPASGDMEVGPPAPVSPKKEESSMNNSNTQLIPLKSTNRLHLLLENAPPIIE